MIDTYARLLACEGKVAFASFKRAAAAAAARRPGRQAYHCRFCQKFHVGRFSPKPPKAPRRKKRGNP